MIGILITAGLFILAAFQTGVLRIVLIVFGLISAALVAVGLGLVAGMKAAGDLPAETGGKSATEKTAKGKYPEPKKMKPEPEPEPAGTTTGGKAATVDPETGHKGAAGYKGRRDSKKTETPSRAEGTRGDRSKSIPADRRSTERGTGTPKSDTAAPRVEKWTPSVQREKINLAMGARSYGVQVNDAATKRGSGMF